jgi:hypothetical protein
MQRSNCFVISRILIEIVGLGDGLLKLVFALRQALIYI